VSREKEKRWEAGEEEEESLDCTVNRGSFRIPGKPFAEPRKFLSVLEDYNSANSI